MLHMNYLNLKSERMQLLEHVFDLGVSGGTPL